MTTVSLTALPQPASAAQPRPKLLYLVHRFPYPPNRGDRIRSYHLLRFLAARYQVYLGTLWDEVPEPQDWLAVRSLCAEVAAYPVGHYGRWLRAASGLARGRSATEGLFQSSALAHQVGRWLKTFHFDLALAFCSSMVQYVAAARDVPLIVDLVDVDSQKWLDYSQRSRGWRRWLFRLEGRRLRRLECSLPARCRAVTLAGEVEAELFRSLCPNGRTVGLANGVDMQYFAPRPSASDSPPVEARCVFVGALDYRANVQGLEWFCEHCWPGIRRQRPDATLDLVGRRPVAAVQRLAQQPGVRLVGQVPDVRPYVWQATIALAPLLTARGIQNKVLEALAMGRPLVASPQALEGLDCHLNEHVLRASTAAEWITAVVGLLADPARQERLAAAGRAFVEQHHSWSSQLAGLQPLLQAPLSEMPLRQAPHPPPTLFQAVSAGQRSATAEQVCSPPSRWAGGGGTP